MSDVHDSDQENEFDDADDMTRTEFLASLPPIQGAIKCDGGGNGRRVQLDIPESELPRALRIQLWTNRMLRVTVEVVTSPDEQQTRTPNRQRPRRRVIESDSSL